MFRSCDDMVVIGMVKRGRLNSLPRAIIHHVPTRGNIVGGRWYRLQLLVEAMLKETQRALVDASGPKAVAVRGITRQRQPMKPYRAPTQLL